LHRSNRLRFHHPGRLGGPWSGLRAIAVAVLPWVLGACAGAGSQLEMQDANSAPNPEGRAMSASVPSALTEGIARHTLANGMTVLIKQTPGTPAVAVVTHVKTGYFHEPDELAGISHVIEHMFFNGTPDRPHPEAISQETKQHGGSLNAGTIYDRTSYYVVMPRDRWKEGLAVQADALQNPLFDQDTLDREMQAILQEARRKLDNPAAFGREKMFELAFDEHRMRRWRIGTEDVLTKLDRDDLVSWYEDHYRPSNIVLSVVGDVEPDEVLAAVEAEYGSMERGHLRQHTGPSEPRQDGFRYDRLRGEVERGYTFVGFHTPGEGHPDNPALDVLATVLGTGRSSRLQSRVKEDLGIVTSVGAACYQYDDVGLFEVSATFDLMKTEWVSRELFVELERIKFMGPTESEIQRARNILEAGEAFGQESALGQAQMLASYEAAGDYKDYDRELAALRAVTADDVKRVAETYLSFDNATLLEYVTYQVIGERSPEEQRAHLEGAVMAAVDALPAVGFPDERPSLKSRDQIAVHAEQLTTGDIESGTRRRFELPGGGVLVVEENPTAPTVSAGIYFYGGRTIETQDDMGVTQMMQRLMVKQTRHRSVDELSAEIESLGTQVQRVGNDDWFGFSVSSRSEDFASAFDVLFDVVSEPKFTRDQFEHERELQIAAIKAVQDQSGALAVQLLRNALYRQHPYGMPELGAEVALKRLDADRVDMHHFDTVRPEIMTISVSGRVDADAVFAMVSDYVGSWRVEGQPIPSSFDAFYGPEGVEQVPPLLATNENRLQKDKAQTAIVLAFPTVDRRHPDAPVLEVLSAITGGMGGSFFEEIRGKRGLAYQVSTFSATRTLGGFFGTYVACSPEQESTVIELVLELLTELSTDPPSQEALERAQNYLIGAREIGTQTNAARAGRMAATMLSGRPLDFMDGYEDRIRAVTREDLARVAQSYFVDANYGVAVVEGIAGRGATPEESR